MIEEKLKRIVTEALAEFLESERGEAIVGNIVLTAIRIQLSGYEMQMEKTHPDGGVEKYTQTGDPLAYICKYIKDLEGALRGVQSDAAQARNRAAEVRDMVRPIREDQRRIVNVMQQVTRGMVLDVQPSGGAVAHNDRIAALEP